MRDDRRTNTGPADPVGPAAVRETDGAWDEMGAFLTEAIGAGALRAATLSQPRRKESSPRVTVRPVTVRGGLRYQLERRAGNKALHDNLEPEAAARELARLLREEYRQGLFKTPQVDVQVLVSKKGKPAMLRRPPTVRETGGAQGTPAHNRTKSYVLAEGEPLPFLVELGVMTPEGKVVKAKYDKFRQINRFLEMVVDVLPSLPRDRELTIVDFGCGKSYLTFAMYHLLAIREGLPVRMLGLDLKADVIETCSALARRLGWDRLRFAVGDIAGCQIAGPVDMVVTLHACDTATDAALLQAIGWRASVILSVPCCQHELFRQLDQPLLAPLLKHGLLKERFAALVTDAVRAELLEAAGYRVQLLEFIDMEHTPKNVLIRAVRSARKDREAIGEEYERFRRFLSLDPYMQRMSGGLIFAGP